MSGYRQHSFDPNAYEQPGPPLRPYNWVQWTGVVFVVLGILAIFVWGFGRLGLIPQWIDHPAPVIIFGAAGSILVNSRRAPVALADSEQLRKNRKVLVITIIGCVLIFGAAAILQGAF